jgi:hypothetical protein
VRADAGDDGDGGVGLVLGEFGQGASLGRTSVHAVA